MNQELQKKLLEYLGNSEAFIKDQAPQFVSQALTYYTWNTEFEINVGAALIVIAFICAIVSFIFFESNSDGVGIIAAIGATFCFLIGPSMLVYNYTELKKIEMAPKIFLLEKVTATKCSK